MQRSAGRAKTGKLSTPKATGRCVCGDVNFEKNMVPALNTNKAESIASMEKVRQLIAMYRTTFFINHDKKQTDKLKLLPAFYD